MPVPARRRWSSFVKRMFCGVHQLGRFPFLGKLEPRATRPKYVAARPATPRRILRQTADCPSPATAQKVVPVHRERIKWDHDLRSTSNSCTDSSRYCTSPSNQRIQASPLTREGDDAAVRVWQRCGVPEEREKRECESEMAWEGHSSVL
jgi:hypothetical protein